VQNPWRQYPSKIREYFWGATDHKIKGPNFEKDELELIKSVAGVVAVGLYASHRVEVERFRLGQLNLVREVSTQIANVLN